MLLLINSSIFILLPGLLNNNNATSEPFFQCDACLKVYKSKAGFYLHQKFDCGKEPQFQCPECPHRSKRKGDLKRHRATHFGKKSYKYGIVLQSSKEEYILPNKEDSCYTLYDNIACDK